MHWLFQPINNRVMADITEEKNIVLALKQVYDPEIPVNIYDLGLVYEIKVDENKKAYIKMTLTAPNCPMVDELLQDVHDAVSDAPNIVTGKQIGRAHF